MRPQAEPKRASVLPLFGWLQTYDPTSVILTQIHQLEAQMTALEQELAQDKSEGNTT